MLGTYSWCKSQRVSRRSQHTISHHDKEIILDSKKLSRKGIPDNILIWSFRRQKTPWNRLSRWVTDWLACRSQWLQCQMGTQLLSVANVLGSSPKSTENFEGASLNSSAITSWINYDTDLGLSSPTRHLLKAPCPVQAYAFPFHGSWGKASEPPPFWPNANLQCVQAHWTQSQWNTPEGHSPLDF